MSSILYLHSCSAMWEVGSDEAALVLTTPPEWAMKFLSSFFPLVLIPKEMLTEIERVLRRGGYLVYNCGQLMRGRQRKWDGLTLREQILAKVFYPWLSVGVILTDTQLVPVGDVVMMNSDGRGMVDHVEKGEIPENQFVSTHQHWLVFSKGAPKLKSMFPDSTTGRHGPEADEDVLRFFVEGLSEPGDLVVDPFAGSGTTGKVCEALGRRCVMYETDPDRIPQVKAKVPGVRIVREEKVLG